MTQARPLTLAIDTGSPLQSVAVAAGELVLAEIAVDREGSSETVVALADRVLRAAGASPADLGAVCALRGPGSFTGLRIGLATALGLHQALGVRAAAIPTLRVLAEAAPGARALAVVDALRGEWFVQRFRRRPLPEPEGEVERVRPRELRWAPGDALVGFGAGELAAAAGIEEGEVVIPPPLAAIAARMAASWRDWDPIALTEPLYLRPAPTMRPLS
jgi:tRNA threonylcarbamoyl adenosine modification protein YeaZ